MPPGPAGPIGLQSDQDFATLGFAYRYETDGMAIMRGPAAPGSPKRLLPIGPMMSDGERRKVFR